MQLLRDVFRYNQTPYDALTEAYQKEAIDRLTGALKKKEYEDLLRRVLLFEDRYFNINDATLSGKYEFTSSFPHDVVNELMQLFITLLLAGEIRKHP